jgi:hypothetical protein
MRTIDPIFVAPRFVERDWGRADLGEWFDGASRAHGRVAEVWAHDAANSTEQGPLGKRLTANNNDVLGDLGRAPPKLRLIFPNQPTTLKSTPPLSLWTVLEPGIASIAAGDADFHRPGDRIRAYEGATVTFAAGSVALEVSSAFQPSNQSEEGPCLIRLPPVSARARATLFRDAALSVEVWKLPEWSRAVPDGETCHVLMALTPGVTIDGRTLRPGHAVFIPACGRPFDITSADASAKAIIAYPDKTPTAIWRHSPGPDPVAGQLPKPEPAQPGVRAVSNSLEPAWAA